MKQTAVEKLVAHLIEYGFDLSAHKLEIEQAKEIEKQEQVYNKEIVDILDNVRYWETCPNSYKVIIEKFIEQNKNK